MIDTAPETGTRWELSAPESLVLRDGPNAKPAEVIKLAVLELVARRVLRLVEVEGRGFLGKPRAEVVIGAGRHPAPTDGPLERVATIALEAKAQTYPDGTVGVAMPVFARAFVASYKNAPKLFIEQSVLPALEARGLYRSERRKWVRLFTYTHWERTPAGDRALAELGDLTTIAERDVAEWSEREPRRLATFLAMAGGAALLVPAAYPTFEDFTRRFRAQADDSAIVPVIASTGGSGDDSEDHGPGHDGVDGLGDASGFDGGVDMGGIDLGGLDVGGLDIGGMDFGGADFGGADFGGFDFSGLDFSALSVDFSSFSGIDAAMASIDAGISAGGGDGGGSSGGDGGGSGS